jgi:hypothetical protein
MEVWQLAEAVTRSTHDMAGHAKSQKPDGRDRQSPLPQTHLCAILWITVEDLRMIETIADDVLHTRKLVKR